MKVVCKKCDAKAHSKCPWTRTVFPDGDDIEDRVENSFFHRFGFEMGMSEAYKNTPKLIVHMLVFEDDMSELDAWVHFVKRIKAIPDKLVKRYGCKHLWSHTEDCNFCSFKLEEEPTA